MTILQNIIATLQQRYPATSDRLPAAKVAFDHALQVAADFETESLKVRADKKLTEAGQNEALKRFVASDAMASRYQYAVKSTAALRAAIDARRAKLKPKAPDPTDAAGAAFHAEVRAMLRQESAGQRAKVLMADDADLRILEAALGAPNVMSGLNDDLRAKVADAYTRRVFPEDVKAIGAAEEALEALDTALSVCVSTIESVDDFRSDTYAPTKLDLNTFVAKSLDPQKLAAIDNQISIAWKDFESGAPGA
jgi:hypothetical protein